jgi:hypothetical protein
MLLVDAFGLLTCMEVHLCSCRRAAAFRYGRKQFFFEKKNQKTFVRLVNAADATTLTETSKSFLVLFFKKELLPCFLPNN